MTRKRSASHRNSARVPAHSHDLPPAPPGHADTADQSPAAADPPGEIALAPPPNDLPPDDALLDVAAGDTATEVLDAQDIPLVIIELDSAPTGGVVGRRFDIRIDGRVVSEAAIVEARLEAFGRVVSTASFGQPDLAPPALLPNGVRARQRAFQFNLPNAITGIAERVELQVFARTGDDMEFSQDYVLNLDPTAADQVALVAGPARHLASAGAARPHAVLYIERATIDGDGMLDVEGWAVAMGPILAVQVFADEERVGRARFGHERQDVAAAYATYPNARLSGFSLTVALSDADRQASFVRVQVVCPHGFGHAEAIPIDRNSRRAAPPLRPEPATQRAEPASARPPPLGAFSLIGQGPVYQIKADFRLDDDPIVNLGSLLSPPPYAAAEPRPVRQAAPPAPEIHLFCDEAKLTTDGHLSLNGWAVCAVGVAQIRVQVADRDVGLATFGHERKDVGASFGSIPMARLSGFRFDNRAGDHFDGQHTVRVIVRNMLGDEVDTTVPVLADGFARSPEPVFAALVEPDPPTPQADAYKFEIDSPALANGIAVETVTGRLTIDGWLLSRSDVTSFEMFLDDQKLGDVHYGLARQDVGTAFPDWPNALRSGYAFHCPPRSLRDGEHTVRLKVRASSGIEIERCFVITVRKAEDQAEQSGLRRKVPRVETDMLAQLLSDLHYRPSFRFVLRQSSEVDMPWLRATLDALRLQCYDDWSMLVLAADDVASQGMQRAIADALPHLSARFHVITPADPLWAQPLAEPQDERSVLLGLLLPGDEIGADMLLELAVAAARNPGCGLVYGDEMRLSPVSQEAEPFFKPDFSPDLLYSTNYIGRPWVATAAVVAATGVTPQSLFADGEYDLVLRCVEQAGAVHHVPKLLCQRAVPTLDDKAKEQAALQRMLRRRDIDGVVLETAIPGTWRLKRRLHAPGKVSVIIPTCAAHGYIETCIKSLRRHTAYTNYEIVVVDNIPVDKISWKIWVQQNADIVVDMPDAFNWSIFNNRAVAASSGDYLLFLNDDVEIIQDDWLDALMEHAQRPEVGIAGPQLLYQDGKVQHAGMFLASNGIGRHAFRFAAKDDPCYFGLALTQRNVIAVTGACMLMRRAVFDQLGGFEEAHQIVNNDLDFSLRAHQAGYLTVFTPYATLIHYELASRAYLKDVYDLTHFNAAWKTVFAAGDPFFNPRLSKHADDFRPDDEPVQWVVSGAPIFHKQEIRQILVVKLDHIGDFVTALQPIRRLKSIFPHARITVLAGRASRAFVSMEPSIDELITFDFFHARSQLGERELTAEDYAALAEQLRPYHFDLAVDLRKHPSTRDVLKHAGARFLAGFDHQGQYPNLDIALDWDGDRTLQRKRHHIIDDLMALISAIERATETDRLVLRPGPDPMPIAELPDPVQALFVRPVVAIHPGAGNITKQWPEAHFGALIDLLIERQDVNILMVGGPDEVACAERLEQMVLHADRVASMAGKTSLTDLARLLKNCVLYIGNDSGPKHIAAAVDVPTIGIHSGVVDPVEWGPLGRNAVALRRNMTCSPCYLANADDCPRSLACLHFFEPAIVYETAALLLSRPRSAIPAAAAPPHRELPTNEPPPDEPITVAPAAAVQPDASPAAAEPPDDPPPAEYPEAETAIAPSEAA